MCVCENNIMSLNAQFSHKNDKHMHSESTPKTNAARILRKAFATQWSDVEVNNGLAFADFVLKLSIFRFSSKSNDQNPPRGSVVVAIFYYSIFFSLLPNISRDRNFFLVFSSVWTLIENKIQGHSTMEQIAHCDGLRCFDRFLCDLRHRKRESIRNVNR